MRYGLLLAMSIILFCIFICPVSAINLQQIFIQINHQGDATITISYQLEPIEYLGILTKKTDPKTSIKEYLERSLGKPVDVLCTDMGGMKLVVQRFASIEGTHYITPQINIADLIISIGTSQHITYSIFPDVVTIFPDGYSVSEERTSFIHDIAYTPGGKSYEHPSPPYICRQDNILPLSALLPDSMAPIAAVIGGAVIGAVGLVALPSGLFSWLSRFFDFLRGITGTEAGENLGDKIKEERKSIYTAHGNEVFLGFSSSELGVIVLGALALGIAFFFANRNPIQWEIIVIFILVGGFTTIAHELAHWVMANRYDTKSEFQFWGFGTIIMFLTAWLFGDVFAQPTLTVSQSDTELEKRKNGLIMLAGPFISFIFALIFLIFISFGGLLATVGSIGFAMNILACVYSLLPLKPLDGHGIFQWNKIIWMMFFLPVILLYLGVNMV